MTSQDADPAAGPGGEDQAVLLYLEALEAARTAPNSFPDPRRAAAELAGAEMVAGDDRDVLEGQLAEETPGTRAHADKLEDGFVQAAASYGRRHGISYEAWRQSGVDAEVLARAGIQPSVR